jgi:hypothetical protein
MFPTFTRRVARKNEGKDKTCLSMHFRWEVSWLGRMALIQRSSTRLRVSWSAYVLMHMFYLFKLYSCILFNYSLIRKKSDTTQNYHFSG